MLQTPNILEHGHPNIINKFEPTENKTLQNSMVSQDISACCIIFLDFPHQNHNFRGLQRGPSETPNDQAATTPQEFALRFQALGLAKGASHGIGPNPNNWNK